MAVNTDQDPAGAPSQILTLGGRSLPTWALRPLGFLLISVLMSWPLARTPGDAIIGYSTIDAVDTVMLRGLVADLLLHPSSFPQSLGVYFPIGFPVLELTPNLLDHLSAAPFVWIFGFPWGDNLWWLCVLTLNGLAAHALGRKVGGSEGAGWLAGVAFQLAEPVAREANLHHAPQAMLFAAPLYLLALLELQAKPSRRGAMTAGAWLSLLSLAYWYAGLFVFLGTLPLLLRTPLRALGWMALTGLLLCGPFLLPQLIGWDERSLTRAGPPIPPANAPDTYDVLPTDEIFIAQHGNTPTFWADRTPIDLSNWLSPALLLAAAAGLSRSKKREGLLGLWLMGLGGVMVLGPYLRWGDEVVTVNGSPIALPFHYFRSLHPYFARLDWAERWGFLISLGLVLVAARAPRPPLWAGAVLLSSLYTSENLPLQTTRVGDEACWTELRGASGAVLELPLRRGWLRASQVGLHQRFHGRPLVNPVLLPPGARPPEDWSAWVESEPILRYIKAFEAGEWPEDPGADAVRSLRQQGVSVIAIDALPGGPLSSGGVNRYRSGLGRHFGAPRDLGCALAWWLDTDAPGPRGRADGDAWRATVAAAAAERPHPALETLIEPTWRAVQSGGSP